MSGRSVTSFGGGRQPEMANAIDNVSYEQRERRRGKTVESDGECEEGGGRSKEKTSNVSVLRRGDIRGDRRGCERLRSTATIATYCMMFYSFPQERSGVARERPNERQSTAAVASGLLRCCPQRACVDRDDVFPVPSQALLPWRSCSLGYNKIGIRRG